MSQGCRRAIGAMLAAFGLAGCYSTTIDDQAVDGAADDAAAADDGTTSDDGATAEDGTWSEDGTTGEDGTTSDDGGTAYPGECLGPADCGGRDCVRVPDEPGGYRVCRDDPPEQATSCLGEWDECCDSSTCTERPDGGCYLAIHCGGAWLEQNVCRYDECVTSDDCTAVPHGVCIPRDVFGAARTECVYGGCRTAADCTLLEGGYCAPIDDPCCVGPSGFYCVYPGRCRTNADCSDGLMCIPDVDGGTRCDFAACPA